MDNNITTSSHTYQENKLFVAHCGVRDNIKFSLTSRSSSFFELTQWDSVCACGLVLASRKISFHCIMFNFTLIVCVCVFL